MGAFPFAHRWLAVLHSTPPTSASTPAISISGGPLERRQRRCAGHTILHQCRHGRCATPCLPDNYLLRMDIVQNGGAHVPARQHIVHGICMEPETRPQREGRTFEERNSAVFYKYVGEGPEDLSSSDNRHKSLNGRVRWVAFKNQFFSSVIVAREPFRQRRPQQHCNQE